MSGIEIRGHAQESDLERLKAGFNKKIDEVLSPLMKRHLQSLLNLEKTLAQSQKLEDALLIREERTRLSSVKGTEVLVGLPDSPTQLNALSSRFKRESLAVIRNWEAKYEKALTSLVTRLTKSSKLDQALLAKNELKSFRERIALRDGNEGSDTKSDKAGKVDYALASEGATAKAFQSAESLIDGDLRHSGSEGFAWGSYPSEFIVTFPKNHKIGEINFLLYDKDRSRKYAYQLFVSRREGGDWEMISDHSKKPSSGWQKHNFAPASIRKIKVLGLFNTANKNFQIVEIEAR
ncbi:MAG: hypothetical protein VX646_10450 [Verrucomicrobiota bacterium]|nr:hypothetical protein [Verrucomicrobiales bacterium]MEC9037407.1 hypothetical protein [Verrucomicrobiota bacterium]MEE2968292.1 hypothetical protein [Verrucomicrobiota bacterium]|tara:strand:+ start:2149 stop:3024 length:876 start_codon:yes stop_codon:yes gene_type:complete